ncbi:MAG: GxxExxY protein [Candidatus Acidiferrales bacterium]
MNTDKVHSEVPTYPEADLSERILGAAFKVHNTLGAGFMEKVYENALVHELRKDKATVEQQKAIQVKYDGIVVGDYQADLIVDRRILIECKAVAQFDPVHEAQLLNYLRATGIHVGLLLNFGRPKLQYRRLVL